MSPIVFRRLGFLGAGRMATAMVHGLLRQRNYPKTHIMCTSAPDGTGAKMASDYGVAFEPEAAKVVKASEVVVVACKPQNLRELVASTPSVQVDCDNKLMLSCLAGVSLKTLRAAFPRARNIARSMPNTPGAIGHGITAFCSESVLSLEDNESVAMILGSLGKAVPLPEVHMDAVTAVSGSGPAYVFEFVAALREGAVAAGLDAAVGYELAVQTVIGSALLLQQSGLSPEALRDQVASPGGTTLAGLKVMTDREFRSTIQATVLAAQARSLELSAIAAAAAEVSKKNK